MLVEDVRRLPPPERFLYWVRERHNVALRRRAGQPKPWTDDEVLRRYFFTHPYREWDRVTVWFRENVRDPLRDTPGVVFATICFRWFNLPETGRLLIDNGLLTDWDAGRTLAVLGKVRDGGGKVFTGAYMINSPGGERKLEAIVRRIDNVWRARGELEAAWDDGATMEGVHAGLTAFEGLGGFMAYEVVCDLRWTYFLERAADKMTWCHPGPGASRGLYRLAGEDWASKGNNATSPPLPKDWRTRMVGVLGLMRTRLRGMPAFEMRDAEHSLCEWDKHERALWGDGRLKRTYDGG
jgi:hypothetical protein